jgi:hypothetical protein
MVAPVVLAGRGVVLEVAHGGAGVVVDRSGEN